MKIELTKDEAEWLVDILLLSLNSYDKHPDSLYHQRAKTICQTFINRIIGKMSDKCNNCSSKNYTTLDTFTTFKCKNCNKGFTWHNSDTPNYCTNCAKDKQICIKCGESIKEDSE